MTSLMFTLFCATWLAFGAFVIRWLRVNTRLPIPGREQDVRSIMRSGVDWEVEQLLLSEGQRQFDALSREFAERFADEAGK